MAALVSASGMSCAEQHVVSSDPHACLGIVADSGILSFGMSKQCDCDFFFSSNACTGVVGV